MNWEALGAIGEIVGAVAVVLTLGYLALQIRQSRRVIRRSACQRPQKASLRRWAVEELSAESRSRFASTPAP